MSHSVRFFQEGVDRYFVVLVWFDNMTIRHPTGREIPLGEFISTGKRW
jgi:hypothetical protein